MKLSIIVPVFNEEKTITAVLENLKQLKFSLPITKEIIIVNDGSTDDSLAEIKKYIADNPKENITLLNQANNIGKGFAVSLGIKRSTGDIITIQDADLEYNPKDLDRLLVVFEQKKAAVVYGSRLKNFPLHISGAKRTPLITHYLGNKFLTLLTNLLYNANVTDMETCYKMMRSSVAKNIKLNSRRFELEPELTAKILKKGYKIYEVPINVKPRGYDEGKKITWRDGFIAMWTLIKYKFVD